MKTKVILFILFAVIQAGSAQTFTEKISKEFSFEKKSATNAIMIANINGSIKVVGYEGDKIILEVEKIIDAKTTERLEKGKKEIQLGVVDLADSLIFYVNGACNEFGKNSKNHSGWGYGWNDCDRKNCHEEFQYKMNFTLKVPSSVNVSVRTINDGDLIVENIKGKVKADNINGSIKLSKLTQAATASTINGNLDVEYDRNPDADCKFYSLNGDINANFQKGLAAKLSFESFNGSFYTNINQLEAMPSMIEKNENGKGIKYKVKGKNYKVGNGGALLDFETFNGNVYLKEKTN